MIFLSRPKRGVATRQNPGLAAKLLAVASFVVLAGCATSGPAIDANGNDAAAILSEARELRHADRAAQAAAIVERTLLTVAPGNIALQGELARDLVFTDPHRALDLLAQAFDPASPDPKLLMVGGVAFTVLGDFAAAERMYRDALKVAPNDPAILHNKGLTQKLAAAEPRAMASARPKPVKIAPAPTPKLISAPEPAAPAPNFAERWRIL